MKRIARSYLYVPGDQPGKLARSHERGADSLVFDLEDAVAPAAKERARRAVAEHLSALVPGGHPQIWVRVNSDHRMEPDIEQLTGPTLVGIFVPKVSSPETLTQVDSRLAAAEAKAGMTPGSTAVVALIESARGLLEAAQIALAPRVVTLAIGEADLVAELGLDPSPDEHELIAFRIQIVLACAAAGLDPPIGPVSTGFSDLDALRASTEALRRLGFGGRSAIHPAQVAVINEVFTPAAEEIEKARLLVDGHNKSISEGKGVFVGSDGRMVDEAVVRAARRTLLIAEAIEQIPGLE